MDAIHPETTLRNRIKLYKKRINEIEAELALHPNDWGKFQSEFTQEINGIFRDLMIFERENLRRGKEETVYKFQKFFKKNFQKEFLKGTYIKWSKEKPYGYAGDFQIIADIYKNRPSTSGVDRLYDNFFLSSPASLATRNRKEDFKIIINNFLSNRDKAVPVNIMDLASGPSIDIHEFLIENSSNFPNVKFHCYENDDKAIAASKKLLQNFSNVSFVKENVVKIALRKNIESTIGERFDLIFSTGLFDYLEMRLGTRLIANLKKLLKPNGLMVISNYRDKHSNPSIHFMELIGEWNLVYRTEDEFSQMFIDAGFSTSAIKFDYEQQGIMQYCFAKNNA